MSSFYDDASLVVIPSGYKTSKVYAEKPTDGSGDLTFTRTGDTATRVNSAGLIEKVRTNTIPYSQAFDNAAWSKDGNGTGIAPVVTANNATAPDGTLTADTIVFDAGAGTTTGDSSVVYQAITATGLCTASFYARVTSGTGQLVFRSVGGSTYTTANLTTAWQRFSAAENGSSGFFEIAIRRGLSNEPINASVTVQMWGAQLETGDIATDYIPTTSAAVSVGPVSNVPRLDYTNSSCPRLLLEPQRTNVVTFSEQFDNAGWSKENSSITANLITSPDGTQNADSITENTANSDHLIYQGQTLSAGAYTASVFMKKNTRQYGFLQIAADNAVNRYTVVVDLDNGSLTATSTAGSPIGTSNKIVSMGNGWYRITVTATHTLGVVYNVFGLSNVANPTFTALSTPTYTGNGASGLYVYGAQLEAGSYATSYIPTLAASVTRVADAASKTGISSLIGQTEGTIYFEINKTQRTDSEYRLNLSDGTSDNWIFLGVEKNNVPRFYVRAAATTGVDFSGSSLTSGTHKVAAAYKQNDFVLYVDGALVGTDTSGNVGGTSQMDFGGNYISQVAETDSRTAEILLFKTRLTNAEMQELTTL
jgi:hypothetical protein